MKTEIILSADIPGWKDIYMNNLSHIPQIGDHIDLLDVDFPEHQILLRKGRCGLQDPTVKSVHHLITRKKHSIIVVIHFTIIKRVYL